ISRSTWYRRGKPTPPARDTSVDTIKILKATTRPVPPSTGMGGEDGWPSGTAPSRTAEARSLQFRVKLELEHHACVTRLVPGRGFTTNDPEASEKLHEQNETEKAHS